MQRFSFLLLGHFTFALGLIGFFVPGLPGVVFWLIAVWAYGKSCPHLERKLLEHPRYGQVIREWREHGVVPVRAKWMAIISMLLSFIICLSSTDSWLWPAITAGFMVPVAMFILSRPARVPDQAVRQKHL